MDNVWVSECMNHHPCVHIIIFNSFQSFQLISSTLQWKLKAGRKSSLKNCQRKRSPGSSGLTSGSSSLFWQKLGSWRSGCTTSDTFQCSTSPLGTSPTSSTSSRGLAAGLDQRQRQRPWQIHVKLLSFQTVEDLSSWQSLLPNNYLTIVLLLHIAIKFFKTLHVATDCATYPLEISVELAVQSTNNR